MPVRVSLIGDGGELLDALSSTGTVSGDDVDWDTSTSSVPPLDGLHDVNAPAPADGDGIVWNDAAGEWITEHALTESDVVAMITPDIYACDSLTVISSKGAIGAGAHTDLHAVGGTTVRIDETNTTPGFNVEAAFSAVDGLTNVFVHGYYTGNHTATVDIYNYDTTAWNTVSTFPTGDSAMQLLSAVIADGAPYFDGGGNAKLRFYHASAGNPSHDLFLDYVAISHSAGATGALAINDLTDVDTTGKSDQDVLTWDSGTSAWIAAPGGAGGGQFIVGYDGGLSNLVAGKEQDVVAPSTGTITGWTMLADATGAAVVDVATDTYAGYPTFTSIVAAAPPTVSGAAKAQSSAVGTWTVAVTAGDILRFTLSSVSGLRRLLLVLDYSRP
jgi:hypothetical protein